MEPYIHLTCPDDQIQVFSPHPQPALAAFFGTYGGAADPSSAPLARQLFRRLAEGYADPSLYHLRQAWQMAHRTPLPAPTDRYRLIDELTDAVERGQLYGYIVHDPLWIESLRGQPLPPDRPQPDDPADQKRWLGEQLVRLAHWPMLTLKWVAQIPRDANAPSLLRFALAALRTPDQLGRGPVHAFATASLLMTRLDARPAFLEEIVDLYQQAGHGGPSLDGLLDPHNDWGRDQFQTEVFRRVTDWSYPARMALAHGLPLPDSARPHRGGADGTENRAASSTTPAQGASRAVDTAGQATGSSTVASGAGNPTDTALAEPAVVASPPPAARDKRPINDHTLDLLCQHPDGQGVAACPYRVTLADGSVLKGQLDDNGEAHLTGLPPGAVQAEFGEPVDDAQLQPLRNRLRQALHAIVQAETAETQARAAQMEQEGTAESALIHTGAALQGAWAGFTGLLRFVKDVYDLGSATNHLNNALQAAWDAYQGTEGEEPFRQQFLSNFQDETHRELVEALGFDPNQVSREDLAQAWELTNFILDDAPSRALITDFAKDYAAAQHSTEYAEFAGGAVFEIVLGALLAALTGGASLAGQLRHAAKLKPLGGLFKELGSLLKKRRQHLRKAGHTDQLVEARQEKPGPTEVRPNPRYDYTPDPEVQTPKAGDRIHKRVHDDGHSQDPYTLQADGKPLGAESGQMSSKFRGMRKPPANHDALVEEGWPTLTYGANTTFDTFTDARPVDLKPGTKIYRIVDEKAGNAGGFWAYELPESKAAWRRDFAVKDSWNDNGYYVEHVVGDEGLKAWEGPAAGQRYRKHNGQAFYLKGGGKQLFITPGGTNPTAPKLTDWSEP